MELIGGERSEPLTRRLIVKFRETTAGISVQAVASAAERVARLAAGGARLSYVRPMALGAHVVALDHAVPLGEANAIAARLARDPDVLYAQADRRLKPQLMPNDEFLGLQTYLRADAAGIDAFGAWDITTGSASTVVAVIDTGYTPHAGMTGRILPGYDFITDPLAANDGDGRDADASDPGDWVTPADLASIDSSDCSVTDSSWHGTATSGIVAANSNDGVWTAGLDWGAMILPARALGKCGGSDADVIDAMAWAAGLAVPGVALNAHPARVINMSLGGDGACAAAEQDAVTAALAHGITRAIVVSAGNQSEDIALHSPASCAGVISVGATNSIGGQASYSNFGATLTLSAPGGDTSRGFDGIYALGNHGRTTPTSDGASPHNGTSFSAPMVSGVAALMLAAAPRLTAQQLRTLLTTTAKPFPAGSDCTTATCGAGILDASAAVEAAQIIGELGENYGGLWWNAPGGSESGWGINFAHEGTTIFASWFTYDLAGKAWWLVMTATRTGPRTYTGTLFQGNGPAFDAVPFPPLGSAGGAVGTAVGPATLKFSDADNGTFSYTVNGIAQTKSITRQTFGPLPSCTFGSQVNLALTRNYQDLWWAAPAGSEAGWGINLAHEGDTIFATWYTFDHDHTPMWLVTTAAKTGLTSYTGDLIRLTAGPPFNAVPFPPLGTPGGASGDVVGSATLSFFDGNSGIFSYTLDGVAQSKDITREVLSQPGTVCR